MRALHRSSVETRAPRSVTLSELTPLSRSVRQDRFSCFVNVDSPRKRGHDSRTIVTIPQAPQPARLLRDRCRQHRRAPSRRPTTACGKGVEGRRSHLLRRIGSLVSRPFATHPHRRKPSPSFDFEGPSARARPGAPPHAGSHAVASRGPSSEVVSRIEDAPRRARVDAR
jgi:hypothetical protein